MNIIAYIGARGGSRGLPGKNIRSLAGKPLIAWTIQAALDSKLVNRVVVSSDDPQILKIAERYGAETLRRPKWMASGHVNLEPGIRHMLATLNKREKYRPDIIAVLQPTSPLRTARDIDSALKLMIQKNAKAVLSVWEENNTILKTFILARNNFMNPTLSVEHPFMSRWLLPRVYKFNGAIHLIDRKNFEAGSYLPKDKILPYVMTREQSEDVDTIDNFRKIQAILKRKNGKLT
ncbi:MAG: acylneuraminate cytidylyltransferase family protein [Candidatus Yanofskybacteria bacterium]|nr:acylneuraminate cytidylyltransferase family protein [Candidatus Yanofskybacteria bacterium]